MSSEIEGHGLEIGHRPSTARQSGFTIIELLIATTIFSLVMLIATAGVLHITRSYRRGVVQARTQDAARAVLDDIAESIRYSPVDVQAPTFTDGPDIITSANDTGNFCIGDRRYSFAIDRQLVSNAPDASNKEKAHVLWVDRPGSCTVSMPSDPSDAADLTNGSLMDGRELLEENMRLTRLRISQLPGVPEALRIELGVAYGINDDLEVNGDYKSCKPGAEQSDFCAVSNLSVVVSRRLVTSPGSTLGVSATAPPSVSPPLPVVIPTSTPGCSATLNLNLSDYAETHLHPVHGAGFYAANDVAFIGPPGSGTFSFPDMFIDNDTTVLVDEPGCSYEVEYTAMCLPNFADWGAPPPHCGFANPREDQPHERARIWFYSGPVTTPARLHRVQCSGTRLASADTFDRTNGIAPTSWTETIPLALHQPGTVKCVELEHLCNYPAVIREQCTRYSSIYIHNIILRRR